MFIVSAPTTDTHLRPLKNTFPEEPVGNYKLSGTFKTSRITSLDGLYLINTREDFKFYHGFGEASPTVREIRDECQRLAQHLLPILIVKIKKVCNSVPDQHNTYYRH